MSHKQDLRGALVGIFVRGVGAASQLLLQVVIGRTLGPGGLGVFSTAASWSRLGGYVAGMGLHTHAMQDLASRGGSLTDGDSTARIAAWLRRTLLLGIPLAILSTGIFFAVPDGWPYRDALLVAGWTAGLFAALRILAEATKARRRPTAALLLEYSFIPIALIAVVLIVARTQERVSVDAVLVAFLVLHLATVVLLWMLQPRSPRPDRETVSVPEWGHLFPLWATSLLEVLVWTWPYVVLPSYASATEIGLFGAAQRLVSVATLINVGLASRFAPRFAALHGAGETRPLRSTYLRSCIFSLGVFAPFGIACVLAPGKILSLFGADFADGAGLLLVMVAAQFLNASTGLCSDLLLMTRNGKLETTSVAIGAVIVVVACHVLGAHYGVLGIAVAYSVGLATKRIVSLGFCLNTLRSAGPR